MRSKAVQLGISFLSTRSFFRPHLSFLQDKTKFHHALQKNGLFRISKHTHVPADVFQPTKVIRQVPSLAGNVVAGSKIRGSGIVVGDAEVGISTGEVLMGIPANAS
jgi:hypothetical protein